MAAPRFEKTPFFRESLCVCTLRVHPEEYVQGVLVVVSSSPDCGCSAPQLQHARSP